MRTHPKRCSSAYKQSGNKPEQVLLRALHA
jgi:hypothetical protein